MNDIKDCPCKGGNLDKMIQPAILAALTAEDLHGYKIIKRISETAMFNGNKPDPAGTYRYLKTMESMGLIISSWDTSDSGPAKRIFKITEDGYHCLCTWVFTLEDYKDSIEEFLKNAKSIINNSNLPRKKPIIRKYHITSKSNLSKLNCNDTLIEYKKKKK